MSSNERLHGLGSGPALDANVAPRLSTAGLFSPDDAEINPENRNHNKQGTETTMEPTTETSTDQPASAADAPTPAPSPENNRPVTGLAPQQLAAAPCPTCG